MRFRVTKALKAETGFSKSDLKIYRTSEGTEKCSFFNFYTDFKWISFLPPKYFEVPDLPCVMICIYKPCCFVQ